MDALLEVFISHSSRDTEVAGALIELLRSALNIPHDKIRCTSVDGYRLPAGASTDEQLKREVTASRCFIAILTLSSLKSPYVMFELGARWGALLPFVPLLAKGSVANDLGSPLSALNALSSSSRSQLHQMLEEIGKRLERPLCSPAAYDRHLEAMLAGAQCETAAESVPSGPEGESGAEKGPNQPLSDSTKELLEMILTEPDHDLRGLVVIQKELIPGTTMFFPRLQYSGNPLSAKTRHFREVLNDLVSRNILHAPEDNESTNTRTYEFRDMPPHL